MLDIATELDAWCRQGRAFAVATVVAVEGSAPRGPGAALAVDAEGAVLGGVSGGCVEGALWEECREALRAGTPRTARYAADPDDPFAPALTCGGTVELLITPVVGPRRATLAEALAAVAGGGAVTLLRALPGGGAGGGALLWRPGAPDAGRGTLGWGAGIDRLALARARALPGGRGTVRLPGGRRAWAEHRAAPPRLLIVGAVDFAAALAHAATPLGYRVTVCDARPVFATAERFPEAAEVVNDRPDRCLDGRRLTGRDAVCVLTHDPRWDVPALVRALRGPAGYVGAMGSWRTHEDRLRRLRAAGLGEGELARLRSPIGLDLAARTPAETALAIAAEIVAVRRGGSGVPLTGSGRPLHGDGTRTSLAPPLRLDLDAVAQ
ncbi:xanthine dehydrogenase accessory factor [Streptomyces zhaozhouensis]|uniref:Xanthine dehydrogenase accessory factor n=1 Tax=Streptomyces zhaozhouensis TaxID=1300267 RepID=A0A286DZ41_9ACTN|nr:XdhC/CoxI family protein [Streptomyces zhaozhouensis]SOD63922.1 xanthine dehydrogenase accessory factor [Streptomyces zhaozhouensis]